MTVVAIDIGGSGSRLVVSDGAAATAEGPPLVVAGDRADHGAVVAALARAAGAVPGPVTTVAIGAAGLISHGEPSALAAVAFDLWSPERVIVASDAYAALVGAWGAGGGAIVAVGTGVVGFGSDLRTTWLRSDGWGYLVGDAGGAAWIGARGIDAGLRAHDHRPGGSARSLDALRSRFGDPRLVPGVLRAAANPATALAQFAPEVTRLAAEGDEVAVEIVRAAGEHLADTGISVLTDGVPPRLAMVGGLAVPDSLLAASFLTAVARQRSDAEVVVGGGTPLEGSLVLALARDGELPIDHPPFVSIHHPSTTGAS